jgi:hypothetical protein
MEVNSGNVCITTSTRDSVLATLEIIPERLHSKIYLTEPFLCQDVDHPAPSIMYPVLLL